MRARGGLPRNCRSACLTRISARSGNSVYPAVWQSDNHWSNRVPDFGPSSPAKAKAGDDGQLPSVAAKAVPALRCRGRSEQSLCGSLGNQSAGHHLRRLGERGRRRTRQDQISRGALRPPVKLRTTDPHRTKKTCFFCRTGFRRELLERTIQPFDLMSRRHPLSSTRAVRV
jgi:hypothetical protein